MQDFFHQQNEKKHCLATVYRGWKTIQLNGDYFIDHYFRIPIIGSWSSIYRGERWKAAPVKLIDVGPFLEVLITPFYNQGPRLYICFRSGVFPVRVVKEGFGWDCRAFIENRNSRWFKVTFSSPSWRSLNHWKGSLNYPKKGQFESPRLRFFSFFFATWF